VCNAVGLTATVETCDFIDYFESGVTFIMPSKVYQALCLCSNVAMDGGANYSPRQITTLVQLYCTIHGGILTCMTNTTWSQRYGVACVLTTVISTTKLDQLAAVGDTSFRGPVSSRR